MAMPPNTGGPPPDPGSQEPDGEQPQQPGHGPQPWGGPGPEYPPPEQRPQQHPPQGGDSGQQQPGQYQQPGGQPPGQGPWYPPPGTGPPPPGQIQYPPGGYPGWAPQGPPPRQRTGLIIGVVIAVGILLLGGIGLFALNALRDSGDGGDPEAGGDSPGESETTSPPAIEDAVGACLLFDPVFNGTEVDLSTPCDSGQAFWRITAASDSTNAAVDADGTITDLQVVYDLCGADYSAYGLGELWKDWYFSYDDASRTVLDLYCVEAIGNPDESGRIPVTPDTGSCFDDSDRWWTVPCDDPAALYVVVDTVEVDPPVEMTTDEANTASAPCSGGAFLWQVTDVEGRTTSILCGDETS